MNDNTMNIDEESFKIASDEMPNDLYLTGFSEQVFHCLANICNGGGCSSQVAIVENIDKKYNLPYSEKNVLSLYDNPSKQIESLCMETLNDERKWKVLKVFISSTFEVIYILMSRIIFSNEYKLKITFNRLYSFF